MLGKQPRAPGSLLDESESLGTYLSKYDETSPYYRLRYRARDEAKKAFIHLDTSRKVAIKRYNVTLRQLTPNIRLAISSYTDGTTSLAVLLLSGRR